MIELAQGNHIGRILVGGFLRGCLLSGKQDPDENRDDRNAPDKSHIRQQFCKSQRIADLTLDVMDPVSGGVHRHREEFDRLRVEHQSVDSAVRSAATDSQRDKIPAALLE